ncbi:uncharacterized protein C3orf38 homolog [Synchiropus splendidus]|uniref:uncharacterized protein C3orf38 homolog n=1 Tax=Synchiropus splendidus TaxID=270530 RepID=UPI00237D8FD3|nr:uncharacterized protein C3orf38 homolog [Synchiropus splendidus]
MSELSPTERAGCAKLLQLMSKTDVLSLSDTVTNKAILVEGVSDAVETILSFTKNAEELLKRRRVHRDLIFKYLVNEGVAMLPSSDKHQLIHRCLELWSPKPVAHFEMPERNFMDQESEMNDAGRESLATASGAAFDPLVLGKQFCHWFFQLLNSHNPALGMQPQDWGPQHFWRDVTMQLLSRVGSENLEVYTGAELVSRRLLAMTKEELLLLSPNLDTPGLIAMLSPHGLVLVAVAGTIHRDQVCLGIFEQVFGLIRCPLDNNSWKIKFVKLQICGQDSPGTNAQAPAPTYTLNELQLLCNQ